MQAILRLTVTLCTCIFLSSCGSGPGSTGLDSAQSQKSVAAVTVFSGELQSATVGAELPEPLVALIVGANGQPLAGRVVNFKVVDGGGSVFAGAAESDELGYVRERWTLGTTAGPQKVEVRAIDASGNSVVYATFQAVATPAEASVIVLAEGNNQTVTQLQQLSQPVKLRVVDKYSNPVSGIAVDFFPSDGGTADPASTVTGPTGEATASWRLGQKLGTQTFQVKVAGLATTDFVATALAAPTRTPAAIAKSAGDLQTVVQHSEVLLEVTVTDPLGNAVPNARVNISPAPGNPAIYAVPVATDERGKARWGGYLHSAGEQKIVAAVQGGPSTTFTVLVLPSSHTYDGMYTCSLGIPGYTFYSAMKIVGGTLQPANHPAYGPYSVSGILNEVDGSLNGSETTRIANMVGALHVDAADVATGTGTFLSTEKNATGTWSCSRSYQPEPSLFLSM